MKRSGPPKRRTPLRADPAKARDWERRSRKPLPAKGAKARREQSALDAFRAALRGRHWCEGNTPDCPPGRHPGTDPHHVWPSDRDRGVHNPARGLLLCRAAHDWAHDHPDQARPLRLLLQDGDT